MRYFAYFREDGPIDSHWSTVEDSGLKHPSYIPKDKIVELSEEQYKNPGLLLLEEGVVKYDAAKLAKKQVRDQKKQVQETTLTKFKAMKNSDIDEFRVPELRKVVKALLDVVANRDELSDEPL